MIQENKMAQCARYEKMVQMLLSLLSLGAQPSHQRKRHVSRFAYLLLAMSLSISAQAQMLFSETMTMEIDSTKTLQGTLLPVLDFKTEKHRQS